MWDRVRALIIKEFRAIWKDKRSRVVIIGPPIIQLLVFGYAATFDVNHVATVILNEDRGLPAAQLVARFKGSPTFNIVGHIGTTKEIAQYIDPRYASLVVHIRDGFSREIGAGRTAKVQMIVDGRESNTAQIILGYAGRVVRTFNLQWARTHGLKEPPATVVARAWFNPNLKSQWFFVPGIVALLTLVVTMVLTALSVAREREAGTFEQLLVTPFRRIEILIGKAAPALLIGLAEGSVIIAVAYFWFAVPFRGSLVVLYGGLFLFLLAATGVGLMLSSISRTQQQAILGAFLFVVPAIILSGFATPIANMPWPVQLLTFLNPMRYFLVIVRGSFLEGLPLATALQQLWPMAVIALVCLASAAWLFRHRMA
jgi:drug efflux transport system permease protein